MDTQTDELHLHLRTNEPHLPLRAFKCMARWHHLLQQLLTGSDNLEKVEMLELKVDTSETTLNNFGALLPNLRVLKLSGSTIPSVRSGVG